MRIDLYNSFKDKVIDRVTRSPVFPGTVMYFSSIFTVPTCYENIMFCPKFLYDWVIRALCHVRTV